MTVELPYALRLHWIVDTRNGNRASLRVYGDALAAIAALETLVDCTGCTNCERLTNCIDCTDCQDGANLIECVDCVGVSGLRFARGVVAHV